MLERLSFFDSVEGMSMRNGLLHLNWSYACAALTALAALLAREG